MYIYSLSGTILYEGNFKTMRRCVEAAVIKGVDLSRANLRGINLRYAKLDTAKLNGACLWGVDLSHADIAGAYLYETDFRASALRQTCLAESDARGADFRGAFFDRAIFRAGQFDRAQFSCPSLFSCALEEAESFESAVYWHLGETACRIRTESTPCDIPVFLPDLYNHRYASLV